MELNDKFVNSLELLTPDGKYNYVAYLLADENGMQPILRPYDILCQILVEPAKIMQVLIDFFLNINWLTV